MCNLKLVFIGYSYPTTRPIEIGEDGVILNKHKIRILGASQKMAAETPSHDGYFIRVNVHESRDFALAVPAVALRIFAQTTALEVLALAVHHDLNLLLMIALVPRYASE